MTMSALEYLAVKAGALKYCMSFVMKPSFDEQFHDPVKAWVMKAKDETRIVGGKKFWIQRPSASTRIDAAALNQDLLLLVKSGAVGIPDVIQLLEAGLITLAPKESAAKLVAARAGKQAAGYTVPVPAGAPALRYPSKEGLREWFDRLKKVADLTIHMAKAAASKPVKTVESLLSKT